MREELKEEEKEETKEIFEESTPVSPVNGLQLSQNIPLELEAIHEDEVEEQALNQKLFVKRDE